MSKLKCLNENSTTYTKIQYIEKLMGDAGLVITGSHLKITIKDGPTYNIGRDMDSFPRYIDEPFWRQP